MKSSNFLHYKCNACSKANQFFNVAWEDGPGDEAIRICNTKKIGIKLARSVCVCGGGLGKGQE